jgi:hypothetical protein
MSDYANETAWRGFAGLSQKGDADIISGHEISLSFALGPALFSAPQFRSPI